MNDYEIDELLRDEDENGEMQIGSTRHYGGFEPVTLQEVDNEGDADENGEMEIGSTREYGVCEPMTLQEIDNEGNQFPNCFLIFLNLTYISVSRVDQDLRRAPSPSTPPALLLLPPDPISALGAASSQTTSELARDRSPTFLKIFRVGRIEDAHQVLDEMLEITGIISQHNVWYGPIWTCSYSKTDILSAVWNNLRIRGGMMSHVYSRVYIYFAVQHKGMGSVINISSDGSVYNTQL
ncbi:hypothetical protein LXL04_009091 [Taraxacum kok-saghyz]